MNRPTVFIIFIITYKIWIIPLTVFMKLSHMHIWTRWNWMKTKPSFSIKNQVEIVFVKLNWILTKRYLYAFTWFLIIFNLGELWQNFLKSWTNLTTQNSLIFFFLPSFNRTTKIPETQNYQSQLYPMDARECLIANSLGFIRQTWLANTTND